MIKINNSTFTGDKINRFSVNSASKSSGIWLKPVKISSYDFWVKCAPVSAHIRLKEANLNS